MKKTKGFSILMLIVFTALSFLFTSACKKEDTAKSQLIKVGVILPLTGNFSKIGLPKKEAFELAAKEINESGGINGERLDIVYEDSKGMPKEGVNIFTKLINLNKMKMFYIDLTPIAMASVQIADQNQVLTFVGSAHPTITDQSEWVFRFFPSGKQEIEILASYLLNNQLKKLWILYIGDTYGEELQAILQKKIKENGGEIIGVESYMITQQDFRDTLTKIKNSNFEKLVILGYGVGFPYILKQANELNIPSEKITGNMGFIGTPEIFQLDQKLTNNIVFVGPRLIYKLNNLDKYPNVKKFVENYYETFKNTPTFVSAYAYDAIMVLSQALKQSNNNLANLRDNLKKIKNYEGITGTISIKDNRDSYTDMMLAKYANGKIIPIN